MIYNHIKTQSRFKLHPSKQAGKFSFCLSQNTICFNDMLHSNAIHRLKQSWTKFRMNGKSCVQNRLSNPFHLRRHREENLPCRRSHETLVLFVSFVFNRYCHKKKKGAFTPQNQPRGRNGLSESIPGFRI
jgi:hypothetical protein